MDKKKEILAHSEQSGREIPRILKEEGHGHTYTYTDMKLHYRMYMYVCAGSEGWINVVTLQREEKTRAHLVSTTKVLLCASATCDNSVVCTVPTYL